MAEKNQPTIEDLKAPLLAAVGAADLALATVNEIVGTLRERGYRVADSDANFVLFEVGGDQKVVWQHLLDAGVLIRDVGLPGWLRVTAGTEEETDAFLEGLR